MSWRYLINKESGGNSPVFVLKITERGVAHYIKPNPWALRPGDERAGWTKKKSVQESELRGEVPAEIVKTIHAAIGEVPG